MTEQTDTVTVTLGTTATTLVRLAAEERRQTPEQFVNDLVCRTVHLTMASEQADSEGGGS